MVNVTENITNDAINWVTAKTLAAHLGIPISWVTSGKEKLPTLVIDGVTFYKMRESAMLKHLLVKGPRQHFKDPYKMVLNNTNTFIEREHGEALEKIFEEKKARGIKPAELARRAYIGYYLGIETDPEKQPK